MRRSTLNFVVDLVTLLVMFGMIATGLVIRFVLPPGTGGRHGGVGKALWGMGRHDWGDVHFWLSAAIGVLLLIHVALHWAWVCTSVQRIVRGGRSDAAKSSPRTRNLYGVGFLLAIIIAFAGFLWIAWANTVPTVSPDEHKDTSTRPRGTGEKTNDGNQTDPGRHSDDQAQHWGRRTLAEIETEYGVPATFIRERLGLPASAPLDERLGRLSQKTGSRFEPSDVRGIIEEYRESASPRVQE